MKIVYFLFIGFFTSMHMYGQTISGQWNGLISLPGTQLRVVMHISQDDTAYTATMDSPDQGASGIPVPIFTFEDAILKFEIPTLFLKYEGKLQQDTIVGEFIQSGQKLPLSFTRDIPEKEKLIRPQEPTAPYSYLVEEVSFQNTIDSITLAGTLTLPRNRKNLPAVILISGSGPQNRDEELLGHKPFLVLADHLTQKGIAVLRFDDRGTAQSTGDHSIATTADFATDVEAAIGYLKSRSEIDMNKIGLIGHSEGGLIAPMVAAKTQDVSFIVLLAGTGVPGDELLLMQQEMIGKVMAKSETELEYGKNVIKSLSKHIDSPNLSTLLTDFMQKAMEDTALLKSLNGLNKEDYIAMQVRQLTSPWMRYFIKYDPRPTLEKVKCPVLAINGERDLQVPAKINLAEIKKALKRAGNGNYTIKELPTLNHLFQECNTGSPAEYATIEQTFSPIALTEVSGWILRVVE